jgi:hypothetical protein
VTYALAVLAGAAVGALLFDFDGLLGALIGTTAWSSGALSVAA